MDEESPAVRLARELTGANQVEAVGLWHEAGQFQRAGIPAVICGPGDIAQAHRADEFVALSQLAACEAFLKKVIARGVCVDSPSPGGGGARRIATRGRGKLRG